MNETQAPFEQASLGPATTGLPFAIFVSQQGGEGTGPSIGVAPVSCPHSTEAITVTLESPPRALGPLAPSDLALVTRWIALNRATLEGYWSGEIAFTDDMLGQIRAV